MIVKGEVRGEKCIVLEHFQGKAKVLTRTTTFDVDQHEVKVKEMIPMKFEKVERKELKLLGGLL